MPGAYVEDASADLRRTTDEQLDMERAVQEMERESFS